MSTTSTHDGAQARDRFCELNERWKPEPVYEKPGVHDLNTHIRFTVVPIQSSTGKKAFNIEFFKQTDDGLQYDTSTIATDVSDIRTAVSNYLNKK